MAFYSFVEYLKYSWKAKGRHGTHSPFVYEFVEQVLMEKGALDQSRLIAASFMELKYENLMTRIAAHYNYNNDSIRYGTDLSLLNTPFDMLIINEQDAGKWVGIFEQHLPWLNRNGTVVVTHIHKTKNNTAAWQKMLKHPGVPMSIDLFDMGILFFREDFKEKQHFVLKY